MLPLLACTQTRRCAVTALGLKVAINDKSTATLKGRIYLDDLVLSTRRRIIFDFERFEVEKDFITIQRALQSCSRPVIRVFIFADGRAAPDFLSGGDVRGLDEFVLEDFGLLLEAARQSDLLLMPVLLDFGWCDTARFVNGVQLGGHSNLIRNAAMQESFLERAVIPLVEACRNSPQILAWDIINEPEWAVDELGDKSLVRDPVQLDEMREFVRRCVETIHQHSPHRVTVGSARRSWLTHWKDIGLDLYQFHWYDHLAPQDPFPWPPYADLGLDKPCIVGEVPTASTKYTPTEFLDAAYKGGYAGLLVWSYRAADSFSDFRRAAPQLAEWCGRSRG